MPVLARHRQHSFPAHRNCPAQRDKRKANSGYCPTLAPYMEGLFRLLVAWRHARQSQSRSRAAAAGAAGRRGAQPSAHHRRGPAGVRRAGPGGAVEDIARHAGVGVATLYRRFPTRADLIAGAFEAKMTAYADAVNRALADPDPWGGFCAFIEGLRHAGRGPGFRRRADHDVPDGQAVPGRTRPRLQGLHRTRRPRTVRGKTSCGLRPRGPGHLSDGQRRRAASTADAAPGTWRRFAAYMVQAFSAASAGPLPAPPAPDAIYRALLRLHQPGGRRGY